MTQYGFFFDQSRCYGCQACATACKDWNGIAPGPEKWMTVYEWETGTFPRTRIHTLAFSCGHARNPPVCLPVLKVPSSRKTSLVRCSLTTRSALALCSCAAACPFGAPKFASDDEGTKMSKCTMCIDKLSKGEQPQCALACPLRALDFGPIEELEAKYGAARSLEGMPDTSVLRPAMVFKPLGKRTDLVPLDDKKVIALNAKRGELPDLFECEEEVLDIPEDLIFRSELKMKHDSMATLMNATRNDLG